MGDSYKIFGSELSPYSVKVRSFFRYKRIPHQWMLRSSANQQEFDRSAKLPLIPLVVTPDGQGIQDSTPILEHFEALFPNPSIHPADPSLAFLSALVEEYADEWGNKPMFHYRWSYEADCKLSAERIASQMMPDLDADSLAGAVTMVSARMVPRLSLVGSSDETKELIEQSLQRQLSILEKHLGERLYLFGNRPAFADFGLFAQLYECSIDPTPGAIIKENAPAVVAWLERMLDPKEDGDFESWGTLEATLLPLFTEEVGRVFFPWTVANAAAVALGEKEFSLQIRGNPYKQSTQKYHAKSLATLRARYQGVADRKSLDEILKQAGCHAPLQ